nr:MAG TPA: hypothetical protein [Caudoviricetes sp.]
MRPPLLIGSPIIERLFHSFKEAYYPKVGSLFYE